MCLGLKKICSVFSCHVKWFRIIILKLELHLIWKYLNCHALKYKVSKFLIGVFCLNREKWHWSWGIVKTESRGKIRKLQKKDSCEKANWRKSCRTVSVKLCIWAPFGFIFSLSVVFFLVLGRRDYRPLMCYFFLQLECDLKISKMKWS